MVRKLLLLVMAALALTLGLAPAASATPTVSLKPGDALSDSLDQGFCSFAAFGRDNADRLIGLTAGHCAATGLVNVYKHNETSKGVIGHFTNVWKSGGLATNTLDYAVVVLDEAKVQVRNEFVNVDTGVTHLVTVIDAPATSGNWGENCMVGQVNTDCNTNGYVKVSTNWVQTLTAGGSGDSGGGLFIDNKLAGIYNGLVLTAFPPHISTNIEGALADINAQGSYGAGFTLVSTF
jgi:hypothetical protein